MSQGLTGAQLAGWNEYNKIIHANSGGGPPSVQRRERIKTSLLDSTAGRIRCPGVLRLGFEIVSGEDPHAVLARIVADRGGLSPEILRDEFDLPKKAYICRPAERKAPWPCSLSATPHEVLRHALMLGLCTAQVYDPRRPIIWTHASLTRRIDLFDPEGFYV